MLTILGIAVPWIIDDKYVTSGRLLLYLIKFERITARNLVGWKLQRFICEFCVPIIEGFSYECRGDLSEEIGLEYGDERGENEMMQRNDWTRNVYFKPPIAHYAKELKKTNVEHQ